MSEIQQQSVSDDRNRKIPQQDCTQGGTTAVVCRPPFFF